MDPGARTGPSRPRHAVAELGAVLDVVHAGDGVMTAEQERGVVARVTMPRRRIGRRRLTEGEASELDERELDRDIAAAGRVKQASTGACSAKHRWVERVVAQRLELEVALHERPDDAVFSGGAGINGERHTRTGGEVVEVTVALAGVAVPRRCVVDSPVERGVNAQITTELEAGVGARNVEETGTIQGTDPHVLDRFGLDGKISCLCPTHGEKTRR